MQTKRTERVCRGIRSRFRPRPLVTSHAAHSRRRPGSNQWGRGSNRCRGQNFRCGFFGERLSDGRGYFCAHFLHRFNGCDLSWLSGRFASAGAGEERGEEHERAQRSGPGRVTTKHAIADRVRSKLGANATVRCFKMGVELTLRHVRGVDDHVLAALAETSAVFRLHRVPVLGARLVDSVAHTALTPDPENPWDTMTLFLGARRQGGNGLPRF